MTSRLGKILGPLLSLGLLVGAFYLLNRSLRDVSWSELWAALNREWIALFPDPADRPARHTMGADLAGGLLAQCDFVAVVQTDTPDRARQARATEEMT